MCGAPTDGGVSCGVTSAPPMLRISTWLCDIQTCATVDALFSCTCPVAVSAAVVTILKRCLCRAPPVCRLSRRRSWQIGIKAKQYNDISQYQSHQATHASNTHASKLIIDSKSLSINAAMRMSWQQFNQDVLLLDQQPSAPVSRQTWGQFSAIAALCGVAQRRVDGRRCASVSIDGSRKWRRQPSAHHQQLASRRSSAAGILHPCGFQGRRRPRPRRASIRAKMLLRHAAAAAASTGGGLRCGVLLKYK